jgi:hypothetical protein
MVDLKKKMGYVDLYYNDLYGLKLTLASLEKYD